MRSLPFHMMLAARALTPPAQALAVGGKRYDVDLDDGAVLEHTGGETVRRPIAHVMGGKNVFYFLTPLDRGRLQVLPVAYDVREKGWYDTTASMVRHAIGHPDDPVDWTEIDSTRIDRPGRVERIVNPYINVRSMEPAEQQRRAAALAGADALLEGGSGSDPDSLACRAEARRR